MKKRQPSPRRCTLNPARVVLSRSSPHGLILQILSVRSGGGMDCPRTKRSAAVRFLPDDAIEEILSRVPAKSLCRFKCVSKGWRDLISGLLRFKKQLPRALEGFFYVDQGVRGGGGGNDGGHGKERALVDPPRPSSLQWRLISTSGGSVPLVPSFSFLLEQVFDTECIGLLDSCNGLLLFGHKRFSDKYYTLGYIVCNPATKEWVSVPGSGWSPFPYGPYPDSDETEGEEDSDSDGTSNYSVAYLIFDPAVSSHFQLVEIWIYWDSDVESLHTYSSETGEWSVGASGWSEYDGTISLVGSAFVCGMLHLSFTRYKPHQELLVAIDREGRRCWTMSWPEKRGKVVFVGQSQGLLHYMTKHGDKGRQITELCIWVLQDYDAEEWVLKHRVSFLRLFGRMKCRIVSDYDVVAIHPDRNVVFFFQHWDQKLKSYDLDSEEVCTLCILGQGPRPVLPYFPYFAELPAFH
ncbi:hypothetical protein BS78_09G017100 [Paspalum vaginatum]|nr:hypothetical protein BS78_09G017100 [Paspalum vaginatum]